MKPSLLPLLRFLRRFPVLASLTAMPLLGGIAVRAADTPASRPNVLVIFIDDLGYGDLGQLGGKRVPTPNMDSIARNGVQFTNSYVTGCVCSPSRAALITGRYQQRFGMDFLADGEDPADRGGPRALDLHETTLAQRFHTLGYATGMVGKWHLAEIATTGTDYMPNARGFDEYYGILTASFNMPGTKVYRNTQPEAHPPAWANLTQTFAQEAKAFISRHREQPWFLYLPTTAVHSPFVAPPEFLKMFGDDLPARESNYLAMLADLDNVVGQVLTHLRELGLEEKTLILLASDNGGPHEGPAFNGVYRGGKFSLWEGGIRSPIFIQWKGTVPAGRQIPALVTQLDFAPTALAAAGAALRPEDKLDGANLLPLMLDPSRPAPHSALFWRFGPQYAVRQGDWKLLKPEVDAPRMLFNLADDPGERNNLAAAHPEKVRELDRLWNEWNHGNETPRWFDERWNGLPALEAIRAARLKGEAARAKNKN